MLLPSAFVKKHKSEVILSDIRRINVYGQGHVKKLIDRRQCYPASDPFLFGIDELCSGAGILPGVFELKRSRYVG